MPAFADAHGSAATGGLLLAALSAGNLTGGLVYGSRSWPGAGARRLTVLLGLLGVGFALLATAGEPIVLALQLALAGLVLAPSTVVGSTLLDHVAPPGTTTEAFAVLVMGIVAGSAAGNALGGALVDEASYELATLTAGALAAAGGVLAWAAAVGAHGIRRRNRPTVTESGPPIGEPARLGRGVVGDDDAVLAAAVDMLEELLDALARADGAAHRAGRAAAGGAVRRDHADAVGRADAVGGQPRAEVHAQVPEAAALAGGGGHARADLLPVGSRASAAGSRAAGMPWRRSAAGALAAVAEPDRGDHLAARVARSSRRSRCAAARRSDRRPPGRLVGTFFAPVGVV